VTARHFRSAGPSLCDMKSASLNWIWPRARSVELSSGVEGVGARHGSAAMRVAVRPTAVGSADSRKTSRGRLDRAGAGGWSPWSELTPGCSGPRAPRARSRGS
jgi:hypothetical protein